jgi:hypothetical protein
MNPIRHRAGMGLAAIVVLALMNAGCQGYVRSSSQPATKQALNVSVSAPSSGATVSGTVTITATAKGSAISKVRFQVDGTTIASAVTASPYSAQWNTATVANGKHNLTAVAMDASGSTATSAGVPVTVNNASSPAVSPSISVSLTSPLSDAVVTGIVSVTASASATHGIAGVQFSLDGVDLGAEVTKAPYSMSWDTSKVSDGNHTLSARASDTQGNSKSATEAVVVETSSTTPGAGWMKLRGTTLTGGSENMSPCPAANFNGYNYDFGTNCVNVILDPSSGIADTTRDRLLLWGGGHADYAGNEIYSVELACALNATCAPLIRLDPPAPPLPANSVGTNERLGLCAILVGCFPTGDSPNARHLYDGGVYVPSLDIVVQIGGALWPNGVASQAIWHLAANSVNSTCAPNCNPGWTEMSTPFPGNVDITTGLDSSTGLVWATNQSNLFSYDPSNGTLTNQGSAPQDYYYTGVFDPVHRYLIEIGPETNPVLYYDIAAGAPYTQHVPTTTGCAALNGGKGSGGPGGQGTQYPGLAWDPVSNQVVIYLNGGNVLYLLDPTTWTCTNETHGSTQGGDYPQNTAIPVGSAAAGTFKRFNYFPKLDLYVLCNDPKRDCWALKRN